MFCTYTMQRLRSFCTVTQQQLHNLFFVRHLKWCSTYLVTRVYVYAEFQQPLRDIQVPRSEATCSRVRP